MDKFKYLIQVMDQSAKRHGSGYPLTLGHLCNILELVDRTCDEAEEKADKDLDEVYMQLYADSCGDR